MKKLASIAATLLAGSVRDGLMEISDVQRMANGEPPLAWKSDVHRPRTRLTKADTKAADRAKEKARRKARALARRG